MSFLAKSHKNIEITPKFYHKVGAISSVPILSSALPRG